MGQIEDIRAFVQIVEQESIGKAAEQAGIAKSAMSRKLRLLEERMETVLIARTTRQWSLTETGRQFYERGLSPYAIKPRGIYIVYPEARYLSHRTQALMEFLLARIVND